MKYISVIILFLLAIDITTKEIARDMPQYSEDTEVYNPEAIKENIYKYRQSEDLFMPSRHYDEVSIFLILIILSIVWFHIKNADNTSILIGTSLMLIGGMSNILELYLLGYVQNMIPIIIDIQDLPPVLIIFNIADVYLTIGAFILIYRIIKGDI